MSNFTRWIRLVLPVVVALGSARAGAAQAGVSGRISRLAQPAPAVFDDAAADSLARAAERLYTSPRQTTTAARLQLRSAALRRPGAPARLESLRMASRLFGYAGKWTEARQTMVAFADEALATGNAAGAAHAYLDAALMATQQKRWDDVRALAERAAWLASLPGVSGPRRAGILGRIDPSLRGALIPSNDR